MTDTTKVMYIVVVDGDVDITTAILEEDGSGNWKDSFRYTRPVLQSTLQLMGCKARHAFKVITLLLSFFFFFSDSFFFWGLIYFPITSLSSSSDSLFLSFNGLRVFPFNFYFNYKSYMDGTISFILTNMHF